MLAPPRTSVPSRFGSSSTRDTAMREATPAHQAPTGCRAPVTRPPYAVTVVPLATLGRQHSQTRMVTL